MPDRDPWLPQDSSKLLVADPAKREPVSFDSDGHRLAAHLYRPPEDKRAKPTPGGVPVATIRKGDDLAAKLSGFEEAYAAHG